MTVKEINVAEVYDLSAYQIDNLYTLARFLAGDEIPPPQFHIVSWMEDNEGYNVAYVPFDKRYYHECGTTACAVGHGPLAGIPGEAGEAWAEYANRVFGITTYHQTNAFNFLFGPRWAINKEENTAKGTAKRIFYFLKYGVPEFFAYYVSIPSDTTPWRGIDLATESLMVDAD